MNKTSVLSAAMCVTVGFSSFMLPVLAAEGLKSAQGQIMEQGVPQEYMEDFVIQESYFEEISVFLSEEEVQPFKDEAVQAFKKYFDLDISEDLLFDYEGKQQIGGNGITLSLSWTKKADSSEKQDISFSAHFFGNNISQVKAGTAEMQSIQADNVLEQQKLESYGNLAIAAIEKDLGQTVSEDYILESSICAYISSEDDLSDFSGKDIEVSVDITDYKTEGQPIEYSAMFNNADLSKSSGRIVYLARVGQPFSQREPSQTDFNAGNVSEQMKNEMLEKAKAFMSKKEIAAGGLRIAVSNEEGIMFRFDSPQWDNAYRNIWVTVSYDLEIIGYRF